MDYRVDLDPTHAVIRLTVTAAVMTPELAEDIHTRFARLAPSGGPYAAIVDLSGVTSWRVPTDVVRNFAFDDPAVSGGRTHVFVARELSVFGMSRMFQLYRDSLGEQYKVVHSLEEAYDMFGVRPEDFTEDFTKRLYPKKIEANETVILLAEDDVLVRNLILLMLSKEGYAVLAANDGQEAREICDKFADTIHLLLTDVNMPRMEGPELAEMVQGCRPETKIMIMSGQTTTTILEENMPRAFLRKPFMPPTLLQCVQRVLKSSFRGICHESDVLKWPETSD